MRRFRIVWGLICLLGMYDAHAHPLKLHWTFDRQDASDASGNNLHGETQSVSYELLSETDHGAFVQGQIAVDSAKLPPLSELNLSDSFSISYWLKLDGQESQSLLRIEDVSGNEISLKYQAERLDASFTGSGISLGATAGLSDAQWHHVSLVYQAGAVCQGLWLFLDGNATEPVETGSCPDPTIPLGIAQLVIDNAGGAGIHVNDVRFYQLALTRDEVECLAADNTHCVMASQRGEQGNSGEEALSDLVIPKGETGDSFDGDEGQVIQSAAIIDKVLSIDGTVIGNVEAQASDITPLRGADGRTVSSAVVDNESHGGRLSVTLSSGSNLQPMDNLRGVDGRAQYWYNGEDLSDNSNRLEVARGVNSEMVTQVTKEDDDAAKTSQLKIATNAYGANGGEELALNVKGDVPERSIQGITGVKYGANGRENYIVNAKLGDAPAGQSYLHYIPVMVGGITVILPPRADEDNLMLEFSNGDIIDAGDLKGQPGADGSTFASKWNFSANTTTVMDGTTLSVSESCKVFWNEITPKDGEGSVDVGFNTSTKTFVIDPSEYSSTQHGYACKECEYGRCWYIGFYETLEACESDCFLECGARNRSVNISYQTQASTFCSY